MKKPNRKNILANVVYYILMSFLTLIVALFIGLYILSYFQDNTANFREYRVFEREIRKQYPAIADVRLDNDPWATGFDIYTDELLTRDEAIDVFEHFQAFMVQESVMRKTRGINLCIWFYYNDTRYAQFDTRWDSLYENRDQLSQGIEFQMIDEQYAEDQFGVWSFWYSDDDGM